MRWVVGVFRIVVRSATGCGCSTRSQQECQANCPSEGQIVYLSSSHTRLCTHVHGRMWVCLAQARLRKLSKSSQTLPQAWASSRSAARRVCSSGSREMVQAQNVSRHGRSSGDFGDKLSDECTRTLAKPDLLFCTTWPCNVAEGWPFYDELHCPRKNH